MNVAPGRTARSALADAADEGRDLRGSPVEPRSERGVAEGDGEGDLAPGDRAVALPAEAARAPGLEARLVEVQAVDLVCVRDLR